MYVDVTPNHLPPNGWDILNKVLKLIIFVTQRLTKMPYKKVNHLRPYDLKK